jgi:hypothetical protein
MARSLPFVLAFLVAVAPSLFAQTPQSHVPSTDSPGSSAKGAPIVLKVRWLLLNDDNLVELSGQMREQLPGMGAYAVFDNQRIEWALRLASRDRRSSPSPIQTISVTSGQRRELSLLRWDQKIKTTVLATVSDDRRAIRLDLRWPKQKDSKEVLAGVSTTIPMESNLLIHTHMVSESRALPPPSLWQQFQGLILRQKRATAVRQIQQAFLLVSPYMAIPKEAASATVAK